MPSKKVSTPRLVLSGAAGRYRIVVEGLRAKGIRPLALGALAWLFISGLGLALVGLV